MKRNGLMRLLVSTAIGSCSLMGAAAYAQDIEDAQAASHSALVDEVIVTATRRSDTVGRVPLSITAATQEQLEQQGVNTVDDLARVVPGLTVTNSTGAIGTFTVRGVHSTAGSATTGVYLDDTSLTKRNLSGFALSNGTPTPPLFDIERVEVLRGPQGTLYGGSSQGGTIRFITPTPSLVSYSQYISAELTAQEKGDFGYELGGAVGGPLVEDRLGFRVSAFKRNRGGYVDYRDPYNGKLVQENANSGNTGAIRAAVVWAPNEQARITLATYASRDHVSATNSVNLPVNGTVTTPVMSLQNGIISTPQRCFNGSTTPVACSTPGAYVRPAQQYGPFDYIGDYTSVGTNLTPSTTRLQVHTLTMEYEFPTMNVKSITSYVDDETDTKSYNPTTVTVPQAGFSLFRPFENYEGEFNSTVKRYGSSQEVRFSSTDDARMTWVGGALYSNMIAHSDYYLREDLNQLSMLLYGINIQQRYGQPELPGKVATTRMQLLTDTELAAFGEVNYMATDKLRLTAGVRLSRVEFDYRQVFYGPLSGWNVPTTQNGGRVSGRVTESPVTPKFNAQYQFNENNMVYVNAAKGFRAGGVNSPISPAICGPAFAVTGLTPADLPTTYDADTVWSYEGGAKFRAFDNRLRVATSAFLIEWTGVQLDVTLGAGCGQRYTTNAGAAESKGFEFEAQAALLPDLMLNVAIGYTDASYTETVSGPKPLSGAPATPVVLAGDKFPIRPWTVSLGLRYDFDLVSLPAYIRADYQYGAEYNAGPSPGVGGYTPDGRERAATNMVNMRAGVELDRWRMDVFVNNLLASDELLSLSGGRGNCTLASGAACTSFGQYNPQFTGTRVAPRLIGMQATHRF